MSRQAGGRVAAGQGIGSRGPGETKIEMDRRRLRARMAKLKREIASAMAPGPRDEARLNRRRNAPCPSVAIAGYTNAGKSSLHEPSHRRRRHASRTPCSPPSTRPCASRRPPTDRAYTLTDTVGFVRNAADPS